MTLQQEARALGDPTRHTIYRHLADAAGPMGVAELTEQLPVSHNAVRQHLAKLVEAGLVVETTAAPSGPGRPRLVYELHPSAAGRWGGVGAHERLSLLLVEVIGSGRGPEEVGRGAADRFRPPSSTGDGLDDLQVVMARQGFEPETRTKRQGPEIVLHTCPFETAARADRQVVCSLHLGLAEGLTDGSPYVVDELVANDPRRADCRIRLRAASATGEDAASRLTLRGVVGT